MAKFLTLSLLFLMVSNINVQGQRLSWSLGDIAVEKLDQRVFTYHMYDTTGVKVGSMVTQLIVDDDQFVFIDTSRFDNGSIYEDARFVFSKNPIQATSTSIVIKTPRSNLNFNFQSTNDSVVGTVLIGEDEKPVRIPNTYDITRAELYAFLHALDYTKRFKHELKVFEPTSINVSEASIQFQEETEIETKEGMKEVYKVYLDGKGIIPTNIIYVDKQSSLVVKYEVLSPMRLDLVLVGAEMK